MKDKIYDILNYALLRGIEIHELRIDNCSYRDLEKDLNNLYISDDIKTVNPVILPDVIIVNHSYGTVTIFRNDDSLVNNNKLDSSLLKQINETQKRLENLFKMLIDTEVTNE